MTRLKNRMTIQGELFVQTIPPFPDPELVLITEVLGLAAAELAEQLD